MFHIEKNIKVVVFFIDDYFKWDEKIYDIITWFSKRYRCYLLNSNPILIQQDLSRTTIIEWNTLYPNLSLIQKIVKETDCLVSEICYISNNYDFIKNALQTCSMTVLLEHEMKDSDYGFYPDVRCDLPHLVQIFEFETYFYLGEQLYKSNKNLGRIICFKKSFHGHTYRILASGRYYPQSHVKFHVDQLSYILRKNKGSGKLYGKFNDIFKTSFKSIMGEVMRVQSFDPFVCLIPSSSKNESVLDNIVDEICNEMNLINISHNLTSHKTYENKQLSKQERLQNVKGSFKYIGNDLQGKDVFLLDDIYTTGSTVESCIAELKRHGARNIIVICLGITQYSCNYLYSSEVFDSFHNNFSLRFVSKSENPRFKFKYKNENWYEYDDVLNQMDINITKEILDMKIIDNDNDFMLI